jgi:two-component system, CAI-1 autoinducer sensor kinase/phosphatase CqsS
MSALALKWGLEQFIGKRRPTRPPRSALQHLMKHPTGTSADVQSPLAGCRILLAAADAGRDALAGMLRAAGATVIESAAGAALLDELRAHSSVQAVILDLHAPGLDGLATARAIRACGEPWASVPVLGLAAPSQVSAAAAAAAGINGLLAKPVENTLLYEALTRFMSGGPARGMRAEAPTGATATSVVPEGLLNMQRLESYTRLGMLDELVNDYLPEMSRLLHALQDAVRGNDVQRSLAALHSLLGMSGEAGAQALYQHVRRLYVPLLEHGQWPAAADWLPQVQQLAARTETALKAYCAQQARSSAA